MAFIAMLMVALNPPLVFDTVIWGQSDSVMTFVTLLSIVSLLSEQYEIAWGLAAIAVLVKPQGLMMFPCSACGRCSRPTLRPERRRPLHGLRQPGRPDRTRRQRRLAAGSAHPPEALHGVRLEYFDAAIATQFLGYLRSQPSARCKRRGRSVAAHSRERNRLPGS